GNNGANLTITLDTGSATIASLTSSENFTLTGSSTKLTLIGSLGDADGNNVKMLAGTFRLQFDATLSGAVVASGTTIYVPGFVSVNVDALTLNGNLYNDVHSGLYVTNNLTLNGTLSSYDGSTVYFEDTGAHAQTVTSPKGTGVMLIQGGAGGYGSYVSQTGNTRNSQTVAQTVTFDTGVTIKNAATGGYQYTQIGDDGANFEYRVNKGTILSTNSNPSNLQPSISLFGKDWTNYG